MGTDELRNRLIWQDESGRKALVAENTFLAAFQNEFKGSDFRIRSKPREFKNIYVDVELSQEVLAAIYSPDEAWVHGIIPDYAIDNTRTNKTLYVEVKRQDGWVENKLRSAGRGNAHERSCKLFTPGLLRVYRERGGLGDNVLPFWVVFLGDIARDPKRVREITFWYGEYSAHFFMWRNETISEPLIAHFNNYLRHLLL